MTLRDIRQAIDRQIDSLGADEVRLLQAAAVAGAEFSVASIAAAVDDDLVRVEERCGPYVVFHAPLHDPIPSDPALLMPVSTDS